MGQNKYDNTHTNQQMQKYICIFYCIRMSRPWDRTPSWLPTSSGRNFVRTNRGQRGQVVYEQPPSGSYNQPFTGYTGMAADHIRRQQEYEQARQRYKEEQQERLRQWYEQEEQKKAQKQSPKRRSKSPSPPKKRSASNSPEPHKPNCKSHGKNPVELTGNLANIKSQYRSQARIFADQYNRGCEEEASRKMKLLNHYYEPYKNMSGGKSKRKSKRASKRTAKKRSGK